MKNNLLLLLTLQCFLSFSQSGVYDWFSYEKSYVQNVVPEVAIDMNRKNLSKINLEDSFNDDSFTLFNLNEELLTTVTNSDFLDMKMNVFGTEETIQLKRIRLDDTVIKTSSGKVFKDNTIHFRGVVANDENSYVTLSYKNGELFGVLYFKGESYDIGKLKESDDHIFYKSSSLKIENDFKCEALKAPTEPRGKNLNTIVGPSNLLNAIRINLYWEADYRVFLAKNSSVEEVSSYITSSFAQMQTLYLNQYLDLTLSELLVWDTIDPYPTDNSFFALAKFAADWNERGNNFNGNLAHLISTDTRNGGLAYVGTLCAKSAAYGYSSIEDTFEDVPNYSWTIEVLAHETGHNLGSEHTHACVWNGDNTAIDGCAEVEGNCNRPDIPISGTIMSYCHLTSAGIDFGNGFHPQPLEKILTSIETAVNEGCLASFIVPVEIIDFVAKQKDNDVILNWTTATENDNDYFEIEYRVNEDIDFKSLGTVAGHGTTDDFVDYSVTHFNVKEGKYYYRLKQVDFGGDFEYSGIQEIVVHEDKSLSVYPSPITDVVHVFIPTGEKVNLNIIDTYGRVVREIYNYESDTPIDVSELTTGMYLVQVVMETHVENIKVMK